MAKEQKAPDTVEIEVTAAEWFMIMVTGFTGVFLGPLAIVPGAIVVGMFAYRVNPEMMRASKAGVWVRGLLPAPGPDIDQVDEQHTFPASTSSTSGPAIVAQSVPTAPARSTTSATSSTSANLAMMSLETLARCSTILLVGSRGSGKSTLLRALLAARSDAVMVYDPHASPDDWPMATMVHNSESSISRGIISAYKRLQTRKDERRKGIRTSGWPGITLAADEWGSIVEHVELPQLDKTPGEVSTLLMKEGRKFGIGFVAGAHGFTNKSLGCTGDHDAFLQSFDWIIHMGSFTRKMLVKDYADLMQQIPMGENEQGGTFPLIVVAESPTTGELRLLDMRGLQTTIYTRPAATVQPVPWKVEQSNPNDRLLADLLSPQTEGHAETKRDMPSPQRDMEGTAAESEGTHEDMGTVPDISPQEIAYISMSLSLGKSDSAIVKGMKGYNGRTRKEYLAKVEHVKRLLPDLVEGDQFDERE